MKKILFLLLLIPSTLQAQVIVDNVVASLSSSPAFAGTVSANTFCLDSINKDVCLERDAANILAQRRTTNAQEFRVDKTFTNSTNYERIIVSNTGTPFVGFEIAGTGSANNLQVGNRSAGNVTLVTNNTARWVVDGGAGHLFGATDNTFDIGATAASRPRALFLAQPSITPGAGTGLTVNDTGSVRSLTSKYTVINTAFVCAATTCDFTIGTFPSNTLLEHVLVSLGTPFACTAVCTSTTLSMVLGKGAGGSEYIASFDADAAANIFGDADAELGTLMTRAAAIQGGTYNSSSQVVVIRLISGTGNIGNGSVTNLSGGSVTIWLTTKALQ